MNPANLGTPAKLGITTSIIGGLVGFFSAPFPSAAEDGGDIKGRLSSAALFAVGGGVAGGVGGAIIDAAKRLIPPPASSLPPGVTAMGDAEKVKSTQQKLAEIGARALNKTMGFDHGAAPWWYMGSSPKRDRQTGEWYVEGRVNEKLTLDAMTGWPYGLPHDSEGVKVRPRQVAPGWRDPNLVTQQFESNDNLADLY